MTGMMRRAALAETAAHLEYLSGTGQIDAAQDAPSPSSLPALLSSD